MHEIDQPPTSSDTRVDAWLGGWDRTPGIVSVHAEPGGQTLVWRRVAGQVILERERFRPFVFARHLQDVSHLGSRLREDDPDAEFSWSRLQGPEGSLRYLIDACDGRLRGALLSGASRRLGRHQSSLPADEYYTLGPAEQYLMCTGRTYFGGLSFDDLHRLQFDLETTGLDPAEGRVFLVAVHDTRGFETILEAPTAEQEAQLIRDLVRTVRERDPDIIENHNMMGFDLPFLMHRAQVHGIELDLGRPGGPRGVQRVHDGQRTPHFTVAGREVIDTLDAARRTLHLPAYGLKAVARALGFAEEQRVYLEGSQIAATYRTSPDLVRTYALQDVREVSRISERVCAPAFALARLAPRPYARLTYAGTATGMLEPLMVRAYLREGHALPGPHAAAVTPHQGGAVHLFAEGVLQRVVKADIASLYPSLIRAHRISPAGDPLEVFYHLVDRLTAERLRHKRLARELPRGSRERAQSDALQTAMKTVINSAYGYLAAGRIALFGDPAAADEVTRLGREVLATVLGGLRERGVTLIEADTDGVYFGVPGSWDEARERQVVREVGAVLPREVTLEYEGRYAAMYSHEIKNYALLADDGTLTVRGASLHSRRTEPYADRFVREALLPLLRGDVPGVRAAHDAVVHELRSRTLRAEDVAVTVRLSKTPEAYGATRGQRRETPYEVLLAAGVREWRPGERVRYYRRADGTDVLLTDPLATDYDARHYERQLRETHALRLRKAFSPEDFAAVFRGAAQASLFDPPLDHIRVHWRSLEPTGRRDAEDVS